MQRRAAILAGAIAGGLFGIGWSILLIAAFFLIVVVALGAVLALLFGGADITGGFGAIVIGILFVAFIVAVVMIVVSVIISRRILRKGGVHRPTAVTWLSLLIVLVVNTIAGRIADPFLTGGGDAEVPTVARVIAGLALVIVAVGAGIGAWLLMAHALRAPSGTVVDPAAGAVPVVPARAPEPPATTMTPPPPAPPAAPGG